MPTTPFELQRFRSAQDRDGSFASALAELRAGRKTTHWIWWVFPQIAGLGSSPTAVRFAIQGRAEARAYLADDVLRPRLADAIAVVRDQLAPPRSRPLAALMGSEIDALKLVSSMTLFAEVCTDAEVRNLPDVARIREMAEDVLARAQTEGFPPCARTRAALAQSA